MVGTITLENTKSMKEWDDFVENHPGGTPFHHSCWIETIVRTYGFKEVLLVSEEGGRIRGILPCFLVKNPFNASRIVSLPFSDYGGPLFEEQMGVEEVLRFLISKYEDRVSYFEIRSPVTDSIFVAHNFYRRHSIELSKDPEAVKSKLNKRTVQYSIRKAKKSGVEIYEANNFEGIREFHRLNCLTRKKHGVPAQPLKFFLNLYNCLVTKGYASILLAKYESRVIAAGLFIKCNSTVYYKYSASDPNCQPGLSANHLLTWTAVEEACHQGYRFFDFGRTSPENAGLMRFKKSWGAEESICPYYYYPHIKGATAKEDGGKAYRLGTEIWRRLPNSLVESLGARIYKYFA